MIETKRVWAIYYKVRITSNAPWCKEWVGPCGIFAARTTEDRYLQDCLSGRPFFFRTRALARQRAKELSIESNQTWVWCKHTVRPFILTWTEGDSK